MKTKVIACSAINESDGRLDCGPFLSGALEARVLLGRLPVRKEPLHALTRGGIDGILNIGRMGRQWVDDPAHGIPFLSSSDILHSDLSHVSLISKRAIAENPNLLIREGWTLISRSGTIGRTAYCRAEMNGLACSEHVMRVIPNTERILPGYLYAYLSSRFGMPLVVSGTYGGIIQHIEPDHISDLPVPRLGTEIEQMIHDLIVNSASNLTHYASKIQAATTRLLTEAGLSEPPDPDWFADTEHLGWAESSFSSESLRSLNFDPRAKLLLDNLVSLPSNRLGELCEPDSFKGHTIFKRIDCDAEFGCKLVGQREAFHVRPGGRCISRDSIEGLGLLVPPGTTLIPSHGTLGEKELYCRAVLATGRTSNYAFSGDFYRCIPLKGTIRSGYLFAFLRSKIAFRLLRAMSTGSKQQYQHPAIIWRMPIPRLGDELEQQISKLIDEAADCFDTALDMEEQAWDLIEQEIGRIGGNDGERHSNR